jgi:predicted chitinase
MRATEFITEVFKPGKTNWKWSRLGRDDVAAFFNVGDREYLWQAFTGRGNPKKWEIQFRLVRKPDVDPDKLDMFGATGTGNSAEVMSTAVDITRAFLKDYGLDRVEEITFNAKEDSRIGLYAKMIKRLLPDWDLHSVKDPVDGMVFTLTDRRAKRDPSIDEAMDQGTRWTGDEPYRQLVELELEEGWKDLAVGAAMGLGALGAGNSDAKPIEPIKKPAITQQAQQPVKAAAATVDPKAEGALFNAGKAAGMSVPELAQFLAQVKHESWNFSRLQEKPQPKVKDYFAKKYDPKHAPKTAKILGNKHAGDGDKYHGRGYIQLTGHDNYARASKELGLDLLNHPELAADPAIAAKIAVWFWKAKTKGITDFSDTKTVTHKINPALRGLEDRHANFIDYKKRIKPA